MAISIVQQTTGSGTGTTASATFGSNTTVGNLVIVVVYQHTNAAMPTPSAWTGLGTNAQSPGAYVVLKQRVQTAGTAISISIPNNSTGGYVLKAYELSGAWSWSTQIIASGNYISTSSTSFTSASVTPVTASDLQLGFALVNGSSQTVTSPSGWTTDTSITGTQNEIACFHNTLAASSQSFTATLSVAHTGFTLFLNIQKVPTTTAYIIQSQLLSVSKTAATTDSVVTTALPEAPVNNNQLFVEVTCVSNSGDTSGVSLSTPTGFTLAGTKASDGTKTTCFLFNKTASSDTGAVTLSFTSSTSTARDFNVYVKEMVGVSTTAAVNQYTGTSTSGSTLSFSNLTPSKPNTIACAFSAGATTTTVVTAPSGFTTDIANTVQGSNDFNSFHNVTANAFNTAQSCIIGGTTGVTTSGIFYLVTPTGPYAYSLSNSETFTFSD